MVSFPSSACYCYGFMDFYQWMFWVLGFLAKFPSNAGTDIWKFNN